jgi:hypothetical protein
VDSQEDSLATFSFSKAATQAADTITVTADPAAASHSISAAKQSIYFHDAHKIVKRVLQRSSLRAGRGLGKSNRRLQVRLALSKSRSAATVAGGQPQAECPARATATL